MKNCSPHKCNPHNYKDLAFFSLFYLQVSTVGI